ncbi:spermine synthase [Pelagicoccus sp. SDUM812005]|uniref:spermidine synthase n=1 Tax=Pelagicoccus sp. SDUM812005 TaxID=3041257 RepID=UPI00280E11BF|nr:spermine synthase [Pelagicoccus sp. SDUM812005]MDQ8183636.1 spermine synthase [Pelagicoccus sp. SDUM812005]
MKPRNKLAETHPATGGILALYEQDGAYSINFSGQELMHSKASASEKLLGKLGGESLPKDQPSRMLIGGLGLGFTLQQALAHCGPDATLEVLELAPEVIDWNREHLQELNGKCIDDPRVQLQVADATVVLRKAEPESYDCILLDIDNGPVAMVQKGNANLYSKSGVRTIKSVLKPGGSAIFWSAGPDEKFALRLKQAGFQVKAIPAKVHEGAKRAAYVLYQATK